MRFTLHIHVDSDSKTIKDDCMMALANFLEKQGVVYDIGYDPREMDIDKFGEA